MEKQFLQVILLLLCSNLWFCGGADEEDLRTHPLLILKNEKYTPDPVLIKDKDAIAPSEKSDVAESFTNLEIATESSSTKKDDVSTSSSSEEDTPARNNEQTNSVSPALQIPTNNEDTSDLNLTKYADESSSTKKEDAPSSSAERVSASSNVEADSASPTKHAEDDTSLPGKDCSKSTGTEYAKKVSLVSVYRRIDHPDRFSIVSQFTPNHRRKICDGVFEAREYAHKDLDSFIFDTHLYEFELENGDVHISVGLHCPTKGFPQIFLRIPSWSDEGMKLVLIRQEYATQEVFYRLASAHYVTPALEDEITTELKESPVLSFDQDKRWEFCDGVRNRFKYELTDRPAIDVEEGAIYKFGFNDGPDEFHPAIKCPFNVTIFLCFVNSSSEIRMVFLDEIRSIMENGKLVFKPNLKNVLVKHKVRSSRLVKIHN